jgi:hypothetical protein
MKLKLFRPLAAVALVAATGWAGAAHAGSNVYWSVGIDAAPGVSIGLGNTRPVVMAPAPVFVAPAPVYVAPRPIFVAPRPVVLVPQPVYVRAPVYVEYAHPGKHKRWYKKHHRHHHDHD